MSDRFLRSLCALAISTGFALLLPPAVSNAPAAEAWTPPRTADGQPDLHGIWTNRTITPFERPESLAGKATHTEEEAAALKKAAKQREVEEKKDRDIFSIRSGIDDVIMTTQTSLVIDPPDGRVPVRPEAMAAKRYKSEHITDTYKNMAGWGRCISLGVPGGMFPHGFGTEALQILQTPGYVAIVQEKIHDVRIIPLDGRPHVGPRIRSWMGDSRGHWDGDTLVVETTNFNGRGQIASSPAARRLIAVAVSEALHVTERFTLVNPDIIAYEVTVVDPNIYTAPWTVAFPLKRNPDYQMYEYACHEGNRSVRNLLATGRAEDAAQPD
jgi:hypothetical protein